MARGLIISAPRSGAGKTIVTLGILAAWARQGRVVRAAKCGPDYIDPAFHAAATQANSLNLDSWAMPPPMLDALITEATATAEVLVIEGVMGLFDGVKAVPGRSGSTADLAARYGLPVVMVLDVSGQSQTAAAVLRGLAAHDHAVRFGGVVLNRVGSERHRAIIADAIAPLGIPMIGAIPRDDILRLPERHLGLVQAGEHPDLTGLLATLADMAQNHLDLDALLSFARSPQIALRSATQSHTPSDSHTPASIGVPLAPPGQRIALAVDAAFSFVYPHVIEGWRRAGAEIVGFSPLNNEPPPDDCDCCWLPGGYPELYAGTLSAAAQFRTGLATFAQTRRVHGECGGHIVLGAGLQDADGASHAMAGLLGHSTSFAKRQLALGYRQARPLRDCPIGQAGSLVAGHEFHYVTLLDPGNDDPLVELGDGQGCPLGKAGSQREQVSGTFFHAIARAGD